MATFFEFLRDRLPSVSLYRHAAGVTVCPVSGARSHEGGGELLFPDLHETIQHGQWRRRHSRAILVAGGHARGLMLAHLHDRVMERIFGAHLDKPV